MRWLMRIAAFVLSLCAGAFVWYVLKHRALVSAHVGPAAATASESRAWALNSPPDRKPAPPGFIKSMPAGPVSGYVNVKTVVLREEPKRNASVVKRIRSLDYEEVQILDFTRDFLLVKFAADISQGGEREQDYQGWVEWGEVTPLLNAAVLDAENGAVQTRVPLPDNLSAAAYSPDGGRAIFYGSYGPQPIACEARTEDYKFTRCLSVDDPGDFSFFYGPADGLLYMVRLVMGRNYAEYPTKLTLARVGDEGGAEILMETEAEGFKLSPDGLKGFILHRKDKDRPRMAVDVLDLRTFDISHTFTVQGRDLPQYDYQFVINRDGSELYAKLYEEGDAVHVIDTMTGDVLRVMPYNSEGKYWFFDSGGVVGDSVFIKVWDEVEGDYAVARGYWIGPDGREAAPREMRHTIEAGGVGYAVNEKGTRLYMLDSANHIEEKFTIERPDLKWGNQDLVPLWLGASPAGKRLILFLGYEESGC